MATNQEEIRIRFGVDQAGVEVGTDAMLAKQGEAAIKFNAIWGRAVAKAAADQSAANKMWTESTAKALADQLALEKEKNTASIAMARATAAEKAAANRAWMEEQAAQAEIARGSGGFSWMGGGGKGGDAGGGHGNTVAIREFQVILRELGRGNYTKVLGSLSILLNSLGGQMQKMVSSIMGPFGAALAGIGIAAYALYEDIKKFNKSLVEIGTDAAKSIGDAALANRKSIDSGIAGSAELEAHIRTLADAHETLAEKAERAARAIASLATREEAGIKARGNAATAAINLQEHLGMISPEEASAQRNGIAASTFSATTKARLASMQNQYATLTGAQASAEANKKSLASAARNAEWGLNGTDEHGNVTDPAAFARNKQMRERANIEADIKARRERANQSNSGSDIDNWASSAIDPLHKDKEHLAQQDREIADKEARMLEKSEKQNEANIAAQKEAEGKYKEAVKNMDENSDSYKKLTADIESMRDKYKDFQSGLIAEAAQTQANITENQQAQFSQAAAADRVTPTIADLAGRDFMKNLNADYGPRKVIGRGRRRRVIGGRFDLEAGDGPFANDAQTVERSKKEEMWDIIHGNAQFNDKGELIGGQANDDRLNAIAAENRLKGAGLQTPEMKMQGLLDQATQQVAQLVALNAAIAAGVKIAGTE